MDFCNYLTKHDPRLAFFLITYIQNEIYYYAQQDEKNHHSWEIMAISIYKNKKTESVATNTASNIPFYIIYTQYIYGCTSINDDCMTSSDFFV